MMTRETSHHVNAASGNRTGATSPVDRHHGDHFSVSNQARFGIDEFTAVMNPPEGAILVGVSPKPIVPYSELVTRLMMRVTMSCDHRVIDGATGAKFLQIFKKIFENPLFLVV